MKKRALIVAAVLLLASTASMFAAGSGERGPAAKNTKGPWTIGYDIYFLGNSWSVQLRRSSRPRPHCTRTRSRAWSSPNREALRTSRSLTSRT